MNGMSQFPGLNNKTKQKALRFIIYARFYEAGTRNESRPRKLGDFFVAFKYIVATWPGTADSIN